MDERTKATISAIVVLAANIAAMYGIGVDTEMWVNGLCAVVALAFDVYAIWKNHNFTPEAAQAQEYLDGLKAAKHATADGDE